MIGDRLKELRKFCKLTQQEFAKMLGVSPPYISEIEKNKKIPSEQLVLSICRTYDVNRIWLDEGTGEIWDHGHRTTRGHQLIDEINERLLRGNIQVPLTTIAKIVNIDVDHFPEDRHKIIKFKDDDVSGVFDALITVLREDNKIKVNAIKALLYTFVPIKTPQQLTQMLLEETAINIKERIDWAKHAELTNDLVGAREEWLKAMDTLRLLSTARSHEIPADIVQEYQEFLERDSVYTNNIEKLVSVIGQNPGIDEGAFYEHFPGMEKSDIFYVLRVARDQNKISIRKKGRFYKLYPI